MNQFARFSWRFTGACALALMAVVGSTRGTGAEPKASESAWKSLFDGKTMEDWKVTKFGGEGEVEVDDGKLIISAGNPMSGITWTKDFPKLDYEISLDAQRVSGSDFFCGLTFPVGDSPCSFILGGWGGGVVGLSSIDGADASENETTKYQEFKSGQWYNVRVRVTKDKIEAWLDKHQMVDLETKDRKISVRVEVELSRPLGISTYNTTAALKNIQVRRLDVDARKP